MKRIITLLRHSETEGNKNKILMGGKMDFPLTDFGKGIATAASGELKKYHFDIIYCSNNQRAKDTLGIIMPNPLVQIEFTDFIKEQDYGKITGMNIEDLPKEHQKKFMLDPFYFTHDAGESLEQVKKRISTFFRDYIENSNYQNILLVTHENIIRAAIAYMMKLDREVVNLKFGYCSLTQYEYESGTYKSIFFNRSTF